MKQGVRGAGGACESGCYSGVMDAGGGNRCESGGVGRGMGVGGNTPRATARGGVQGPGHWQQLRGQVRVWG